MRRTAPPVPVALLALVVSLAAPEHPALRGDDSAGIKAMFADPPRRYSSGPLWVWNDLLTEEQIRTTLRDLSRQGVRQVWVHPRPGLMTPYLSDEWFRLWNTALEEAERRDMNVWIYDENSYPSGFAGGLVPEALPDSRGQGVFFREESNPGAPGADVLAVFRLTADGYEDVTSRARQGAELPQGRYLIAWRREARARAWFGGRWYVDLLLPGVTEKFLEITLGAYERHVGDQFSGRVPGVFTDEPHLCPAGGLHWNAHVLEEFRRRWGYGLEEHLPALVRPLGDWRRVRHDYYQVLLEQFIEHWSRPYYEYCEARGLEFTGHYWEHGWPRASHVPDNMAMYAWHQRPGIDNLMNEYREDVHSQFGNSRTVREVASVANQMGRRRTLCEAYGAGGWDLRFEDMKRIGDWLYVLGINTLNEHLSYVTIRGARKRDHPQSFSYHAPWWEDYRLMAAYFTRLSLALSAGEQVNHILLLEPTTTAWMYQNDPSHAGRLREIGDSFQELVVALEEAQVEYDIGCEDIIARHGSTAGARLVVGERRYHTVVLPRLTESLNAPTVALLEDYVDAGGRVLCCGGPPTLVDGRESERCRSLAARSGWKRLETSSLPAALLALSTDGFSVRASDERPGNLFHQRRRLDDGELLFLVNTSIDSPSRGVVTTRAGDVERWDPVSGAVSPFPRRRNPEGLEIAFDLPPCGSLLLFLAEASGAAARGGAADLEPPPRRPLAPAGGVEVRRLEPNVLTLDYVDIRIEGETEESIYFYEANRMAFAAHGFEGNPWDSAVQFRDELIRKRFPPGSGFEATYRFVIEDRVPQSLEVVIERGDLYSITVNGTPVPADRAAWWLDRSFTRIDISEAASVGSNEVRLKASPFSMYHELEPAYVLGDFSLRPVGSGFVIGPPGPLRVERREGHVEDPDGSMWLSAGIGYRRDAGNDEGNDRAPFVVFDLGETVVLDPISVWNYNETRLTGRGAKEISVTGSATGRPGSFTTPLGTFRLEEAPGTPLSSPQRLDVAAAPVRFVRFDIRSNHRGVTFPADEDAADNAFTGLSEVEFHGATKDGRAGPPLRGVSIQEVSSELTGAHDRRARYLVDRSGLETAGVGWNRQGHPFYGSGVRYRQRFDVPHPSDRYLVSLRDWRGSVARVLVNGRLAGRIGFRPWTCDVTSLLVPGRNTVDVVVIGTLKNTLGPHHAGRVRGRAWPRVFRRAPESGPPPGRSYDTIDYGLFEPFLLEQASPPGSPPGR